MEGPFVFRVLWPGSFSPRVLLFEGPLSQGSFDQGPLGLGPFVKGPLTRVLLPQIVVDYRLIIEADDQPINSQFLGAIAKCSNWLINS